VLQQDLTAFFSSRHCFRNLCKRLRWMDLNAALGVFARPAPTTAELAQAEAVIRSAIGQHPSGAVSWATSSVGDGTAAWIGACTHLHQQCPLPPPQAPPPPPTFLCMSQWWTVHPGTCGRRRGPWRQDWRQRERRGTRVNALRH